MKWHYWFAFAGIVWLISRGTWQAQTFAAPLGNGITTRISVATDGTEGNAPAIISDVSDDGRWVVFDSEATTLVPGDTNGVKDVFIHDRQTATTRRLSVNADGIEGNNLGSGTPAISGDGEWVAFYSWGDNLVEGDTNEGRDLFLWERATNTLRRISVNSNGEQATDGNSWIDDVVLSTDGRYIAYTSGLEGLTPEATIDDFPDVFYHDRVTGNTQLVNITVDGTIPNSWSTSVDMSTDGRYVAFGSEADALVEGDINGIDDIFVRDMQIGVTERISLYQGQSVAEHDQAAISGDGRFVAFATTADMTTGTNTEIRSIYIYDRVKATMLPAVTRTNGERADAALPQLSAEGRYLLFASGDGGLIAGDTNGQPDIFRRDLQKGETEQMSVSSYGEQSNTFSSNPQMSGDAQVVVWQSAANNLVDGDTNGVADIFVREGTATPFPTRTPSATNTPTATATPRIPPYPNEQFLPLTVRQKKLTDTPFLVNITAHGNGGSSVPVTSRDGGVVAFVSAADNLVPNDTNGQADIFVWERTTQQIARVSVSSTGAQLAGRSERPAISEDGRYVVYTAWTDGVVPEDTNGKADIFRYDRQTGQVLLISVAVEGGGGDGDSVHADISGDGNVVVFTSNAHNLNMGGAPGVPRGAFMGFVRDLTTSQTTLLRYNGTGNIFQSVAWPSISDDGTKVALAVWYTHGYCAGQPIARIDVETGATETIASTSVNHHWEFLPNTPRISPDGTQVGFRFYSAGDTSVTGYFLVVGGTNGYNLTALPVPGESCGYFSGNTQEMSFSGNGQRVAFTSTDLQGQTPSIPGDANGVNDVFVWDTTAQQATWLSRTATALGNGNSYDAYISGDGRTVYFTSDATNLSSGDTNGVTDILMWIGE